MNEKTINEQYAYIRTLLEEKRLKEALMQLESLLWQCPDWDLRTRLEQLQTSYKYMLEYMKQGANDPERWNLYQKMVSDTWGIADQSRLLILDNASSRYYHEVRRTPKSPDLSNYGLKTILHILESFNDDLAVSGLLSDEKMDEVLKRHEVYVYQNMDKQCLDSRRRGRCKSHACLGITSGRRFMLICQCPHIELDGMFRLTKNNVVA